MSETALPNEDQPTPSEASTNPAPASSGRSGNGLAILALLLGAAGVAAGGWGLWQVRHLQQVNQDQV